MRDADHNAVYAEVPLPYRDPASCLARPKSLRHADLGRIEFPDRPGSGTPFEEMNVKLTPVTMLDGRKLQAQGEVFGLDKQGIDFRCHESEVQNWEDRRDIMDVYFPEVEALVRAAVPGAALPGARVLVYDHVLRAGGQGGAAKEVGYHRKAPKVGYGGYGANVHSDNSVRSMHARVKDHLLGTNEVEVRYGGYPGGWGDVRPSREWLEQLFRAETADHQSPNGRGGEHLIVNVWRPLSTVENWGLTVLDGRTLAPGDVHPTAFQPAERYATTRPDSGPVRDLDGREVKMRFNELLTPLHDPAHRWIYFPRMGPDEVLLFKIHDSRRDGRTRCGSHTAFRDPRGLQGAHRRSIEVRCLVLLPPSGREEIHSRM